MKTDTTPLFLFLAVFSLLAAGCRPAEAALAGTAPQPETARDIPSDCPVTLSEHAFVPPKPWPAEYPYPGFAWYGEAGLWTILPDDGRWGQLALGEKSWWWSQGFDAKSDSTPDLAVTARRPGGRRSNSVPSKPQTAIMRTSTGPCSQASRCRPPAVGRSPGHMAKPRCVSWSGCPDQD